VRVVGDLAADSHIDAALRLESRGDPALHGGAGEVLNGNRGFEANLPEGSDLRHDTCVRKGSDLHAEPLGAPLTTGARRSQLHRPTGCGIPNTLYLCLENHIPRANYVDEVENLNDPCRYTLCNTMPGALAHESCAVLPSRPDVSSACDHVSPTQPSPSLTYAGRWVGLHQILTCEGGVDFRLCSRFRTQTGTLELTLAGGDDVSGTMTTRRLRPPQATPC
jgi:hypothetical protein